MMCSGKAAEAAASLVLVVIAATLIQGFLFCADATAFEISATDDYGFAQAGAGSYWRYREFLRREQDRALVSRIRAMWRACGI